MVRSGEVSWVQPKEKGSKPGPRSGHSITCTQEKAIIFGGCGIQDGRSAIFNETYILHISDQFRWELAEVTGDVPSPRWRHTVRCAQPVRTRHQLAHMVVSRHEPREGTRRSHLYLA